uniref:Uncharacterized protein n=1 Tax=Helianthus annuus TaxID=4232 RepID=A0A251UT35_HELAN
MSYIIISLPVWHTGDNLEPKPLDFILIKQAIEASDCLRPELDLRTEDIVEIELLFKVVGLKV